MSIVLIDDNDIDRNLYKRIIRRSGVSMPILDFSGGDTALAYLSTPHSEPVELIFLDIYMPRMSGFEFLEEAIKEIGGDFAKAVTVMLTTSLDPADKARAARYEVVKQYINKPLTIENVKEAMTLIA